eukprot:jgi/Bigna1/79851/fgenesh1_pg.65_\
MGASSSVDIVVNVFFHYILADEEERIILCVKLYEVRTRWIAYAPSKPSSSPIRYPPSSLMMYRQRRVALWDMQDVSNRLSAAVGMMHREVSQKERDSTLADFKAQRLMLLVTTDVWARGIDVQSVMATINFDLPFAPETFGSSQGNSPKMIQQYQRRNITWANWRGKTGCGESENIDES